MIYTIAMLRNLKIRIAAPMALVFGLGACILIPPASPITPKPPGILVLGDSMMKTNAIFWKSTPDILAGLLGRDVTNKAAYGALLVGPIRDTRKQFEPGNWDWILVNGGANDFMATCMCRWCDKRLNTMLDPTGTTGKLATFLQDLRATGAKVMMVGYHRPRGLNTPYKQCHDELNELDRRSELFAAQHDGIEFMNLQTVFPVGDASFYRFDHTHPSFKGSRAMAETLARALQ